MKQNRRNFLRNAGLAGIAPWLISGGLSTVSAKDNMLENNTMNEEMPEPDAAQKAWMKLNFGMFIHFGINTYYDKEWSDGTLDHSVYNPTGLDTDQWCRVAKAAGMKYIVFVAKHHSGFCNWYTKYSDYSVKNTPFNGDVIAQLADSCIKHGIKLGLYYSLWDRREKSHDSNEPKYVEFMKLHLDELLTKYGNICELWFDGFWKKQQSGWKMPDGGTVKPEDFIQSWRNEGAFRWQIDHLYHFVKSYQPDCIVMNNPTSKFKTTPLHPVDAVCAEKGTELKEYRKVWEWLGRKKFFPLQIETTMSVKGNEKFPSGNWFWHEWDHSVATKKQILKWLDNAKKLDANLLLNCGVMANGKLRPEDEKTLLNLRN